MGGPEEGGKGNYHQLYGSMGDLSTGALSDCSRDYCQLKRAFLHHIRLDVELGDVDIAQLGGPFDLVIVQDL